MLPFYFNFIQACNFGYQLFRNICLDVFEKIISVAVAEMENGIIDNMQMSNTRDFFAVKKLL